MKKIVVVDDYIDFAKNLGEFIELFNDAMCIIFSNPRDAQVYILQNRDVDILITDYEMPEMNGFMLAHRILMEDDLNIRIIICSAHEKMTLEALRKKYKLDNEVEVVTKTNFDFMKNLIN